MATSLRGDGDVELGGSISWCLGHSRCFLAGGQSAPLGEILAAHDQGSEQGAHFAWHYRGPSNCSLSLDAAQNTCTTIIAVENLFIHV
jgi:hypothetical protein